ncbi:ZP domain-containing protein [Nematostella vectensis]|uniref:ZP domain-containing protein n=1 Tax=Nematostella vectensis TaxID=45351 RepID=UPI0020772686|nr:ZP domain-containing protein [Nematostella vectensis]
MRPGAGEILTTTRKTSVGTDEPRRPTEQFVLGKTTRASQVTSVTTLAADTSTASPPLTKGPDGSTTKTTKIPGPGKTHISTGKPSITDNTKHKTSPSRSSDTSAGKAEGKGGKDEEPTIVPEMTTQGAGSSGTGESGTGTSDVQKTEGGSGDSTGESKYEGIKVICSKQDMEVRLYMEYFERLSIDSLRLSDRACKPVVTNETLVFFKVPLDGCGTAHNVTEDSIVYYNAIEGESWEERHELITRKYHARFSFDCKYARKRVLSVISFSPRKKIVYSTKDERGNFTYIMDLYHTPRYQKPFNEYPVHVLLGQPLYVQVVVKADVSLVVFLDTCRATPTSSYEDPRSYQFIEKGCSRDMTLQYSYTMSAVQQFSISAFRFVNMTGSSKIYLHCLVHVCPRSQNDSVCARGCNDGRQRRASIEQVQSLDVLTLGPLNLFEDNSGLPLARSRRNEALVVWLSVALLCVIVIALVTAIVMVTIRKRPRPVAAHNKQYISITDSSL